ncbi:MAG TPA: helix-turn-helix domain-containing protein [Clostridiales bacterium]|nr:helix-turn-helix domain-containing protein [Clostridiales bacterium]
MYKLTTNSQYSNAIIYKVTEPVYYRSEGVTFLCMLSGDAVITWDNKSYYLSDKDVLLFGPNEYYHLKSDTSALILELSFDYVFFKETFSSDYGRLICNSILDQEHDYKTLRRHLAGTAIVHYSDLQENRFYLLSNIFQLFHYLSNEFIHPVPEDETTSKQQRKINRILSYLQKNYQNSISLQDLAGYMSLTPQYLERLMKQSLNVTFYDYLNQLRLQAAYELLNNTAHSLNYIALSCGFPNLSSFQNSFVGKYGVSPAKYREDKLLELPPSDSKAASSITDALAKDFLTNSIRLPNYSNSMVENSTPVTATVSAARHKPFPPVWKDMINLGLCNNFERPSFRSHLTILQNELKFKYGRIQGILDLIDIYSSEDTTNYNFNKIYRILDFLQTIHMYPLFELGNKSPTIYKDYMDTLPSKRQGSQYSSRLKKLLPVFLVNCINRYGFKEVSNWRFELWMEYSDFMTAVEAPADYVKRFRFVAETVKQHIPHAEVGGPGFNTFLPADYLDALLKEFVKSHVQPDFVSIYLYPYIHPQSGPFDDKGQLIIILNKDKNAYKKLVDGARQLLHKHFTAMPKLFVTEYSSVMYSHNYINDSTYQAAFIVKETLDNYSALDSFGYWLISDVSMEYEEAVNILFGGNGLISRDGIKKPSYHALSFLSALGDRIIARDNNYIITSNSNNKFQILAYHYCHYSEEYCDDINRYRSFRLPASAFEVLPPIDLTIQLKDIPPGTYTIRQHVIDHEHGNILNDWLRLDAPSNLSDQDIEYLKSISIPAFKIYKKEVTDLLSVSCHLNTNDIILTEIDLLIK